jgi:predicted transcriptional regulator
MVPAAKMHSVQMGVEIADALTIMDQAGINQLPVVSGDQVSGILSRENIINFLRSRQKNKRL